MRGNEIIVRGGKGNKRTLVIKSGETWYPGMIVQVDPTTDPPTGNSDPTGLFTGKIYDRDADGDRPAGAFWVVTNEISAKMGKLATEAYPVGDGNEVASVYAPLPGDELNLLLLNLGGSGDDHTAGEILMVDDGTGKLIVTSSPETEVAVLLETVTDPTVDTLAYCEWSGH